MKTKVYEREDGEAIYEEDISLDFCEWQESYEKLKKQIKKEEKNEIRL